MAISKVSFGDKPLIDLTGDTIEPNVVLDGYTFHGANGELQTGNLNAESLETDRHWYDYVNFNIYRNFNPPGEYVIKLLEHANNHYDYINDVKIMDNFYNDLVNNKVTNCDYVYYSSDSQPLLYNGILKSNKWPHLIPGVKSCNYAYNSIIDQWNFGNKIFQNILNVFEDASLRFSDSLEYIVGLFHGLNHYNDNINIDTIYLTNNLKDASSLFANSIGNSYYGYTNSLRINNMIIGDNLTNMSYMFAYARHISPPVNYLLENSIHYKNLSIAYMFKNSGCGQWYSMSKLYEVVNNSYNVNMSGLFENTNGGCNLFGINLRHILIPNSVIDCSYLYCNSLLCIFSNYDRNLFENIYIGSSVINASHAFENFLNNSYTSFPNGTLNVTFYTNNKHNLNMSYMFSRIYNMANVYNAFNINFHGNIPWEDCYDSDFSNFFNGSTSIGGVWINNSTVLNIFGENSNFEGMFSEGYYMQKQYAPITNITIKGNNSSFWALFSNGRSFLNLNNLKKINITTGANSVYTKLFDNLGGGFWNSTFNIFLNHPTSETPNMTYITAYNGWQVGFNNFKLYIYNTSNKKLNITNMFVASNIWCNNFNVYCKNINNLIGVSRILTNGSYTNMTFTNITNGMRNTAYNVTIYNNLSY